jgi:hypothetical protein
MLDQEPDRLGVVTNLAFDEDPDHPDAFLLKFHSPKTEQKSLPITAGAARILWYYLTELLFPAASLTARVATANIAPSDSLSVVFAVQVEACQDNLIDVVALSAVHGWQLHFTREEGSELWACLDQALRNFPPSKTVHLL